MIDQPAQETKYALEGRFNHGNCEWRRIGYEYDSEGDARQEEAEYREYMKSENSGWFNFRVVRITTSREILSS